MPVRGRVALLILPLVAACAPPSPRVPYVGALDDFLAAHRRAEAQSIRADEIGRTASASYHVVQVRGAETPHRHAAHDLTVVLLRGHGTLTRGAERIPVHAGDASVVPRGETHWFVNGGRGDAITLVVFTPPLDAPDNEPAD